MTAPTDEHMLLYRSREPITFHFNGFHVDDVKKRLACQRHSCPCAGGLLKPYLNLPLQLPLENQSCESFHKEPNLGTNIPSLVQRLLSRAPYFGKPKLKGQTNANGDYIGSFRHDLNGYKATHFRLDTSTSDEATNLKPKGPPTIRM